MNQPSSLPVLDRRRTQMAIESILDRYRLFKTITFEVKESLVAYSFSKQTSDEQAAEDSISMEGSASRKAFCLAVDAVVERLDSREQLLVQERYLKKDEVYDYTIYNHVLNPPVSKDTYVKLRTRAFYKMALAFHELDMLDLEPLTTLNED